MFLKNYWYVAASSPEIGRKPFRRVIMNEPVVLYRTGDGTPIALRRLPDGTEDAFFVQRASPTRYLNGQPVTVYR